MRDDSTTDGLQHANEDFVTFKSIKAVSPKLSLIFY
jgi:hypothetical protein